jgi:hypothetical protein
MHDYLPPTFSDQEVQRLFQDYLPLHPLPADIAVRLTSSVMCEVSVSLRHNAFYLALPLAATLHRFFANRKSTPRN